MKKVAKIIFKAEMVFTKFRRNKTMMMYGQLLNLKKKSTIKKLLINHKQRDVEVLLFGRYLAHFEEDRDYFLDFITS